MGFARVEGRYFNPCGMGDPFTQASPPPHLEINPAIAGVNRRTAGAFVKDDEGNRYLAHSGKVGGGTKGVSPTNFHIYYPAHTMVDWGGVARAAYVLAALDDPDLVEAVRDLTLYSKQFREAVRKGLELTPVTVATSTHKFSPEFEGTKTFSTKEQVVARVRHGKVVKALREALGTKKIAVFNDQNRDAYVSANGAAKGALFEVKTSSVTTSVYEAIGQLFFHADEGALRVAVLPNDIDEVKSKRLGDLGVRLLTYSWSKAGCVMFNALDDLAADLGASS